MIETLLELVVLNADPGPLECYVNDSATEMHECAVQEYTGTTGEPLFGLIIGGGLILSLYVASDGDLVVPAVITTLFGASLVAMLPGTYQVAAMVIMFLGMAGAILAVLVKYVVRGGM